MKIAIALYGTYALGAVLGMYAGWFCRGLNGAEMTGERTEQMESTRDQLLAQWRWRASLAESIERQFSEWGNGNTADIARAMRAEIIRCVAELSSVHDAWVAGYEAGLRKGLSLGVDGGVSEDAPEFPHRQTIKGERRG